MAKVWIAVQFSHYDCDGTDLAVHSDIDKLEVFTDKESCDRWVREQKIKLVNEWTECESVDDIVKIIGKDLTRECEENGSMFTDKDGEKDFDTTKCNDQALEKLLAHCARGQYINQSNWWIDVYEQFLPQDYAALAKLRDALNLQLAAEDEKRELGTLQDWIRDEWGDCITLRTKIDIEGSDYFYSSYTNVPITRDMYEKFIDDDQQCYCGQNCMGTESENKKRK